MNTVLALLAILGTLVAVVLALIWRQRTNRPPGPAQGDPDTDSSGNPMSDWQQVAQRTHHSQIEALREWMGEDHELVQQLRSPEGDGAPPGSNLSSDHERLV